MHVIALAAITADGKIARHARHFADWTSREDKQLFAATSREAGLVIMGKTTFDSIGQPLPSRLQIVLTTRPETCLPSVPGLIEYASGSVIGVVRALEERGYQKAIVAGGANVYHQFISARLIDELWLTVEPLLFGSGISLLDDQELNVRMRLTDVVRLGENAVQLRYTL